MAVVDTMPYRPWLDRGHVVAGEFRWRLGARPLDLARWIELGPDAEGPRGWIAQKADVMRHHPTTAFATIVDGAEPECTEIADAVVEHVSRTWSDRFARASLDRSLHPLDAAARLVPEDLVVMVERDDQLVFGAGSVCFPNRWDLRSKIGRPIRTVHEPVSLLNDQLGDAVDGFFRRLRPDRSFWRLGWGILDTADGYTPLDGTAAVRPAHPGVDDLYVRVERETLRRFPVTNAVLFTIRTYIAPLRRVFADRADRDAIESIITAMPAEVRGYKDLTPTLVRTIRSCT